MPGSLARRVWEHCKARLGAPQGAPGSPARRAREVRNEEMVEKEVFGKEGVSGCVEEPREAPRMKMTMMRMMMRKRVPSRRR